MDAPPTPTLRVCKFVSIKQPFRLVICFSFVFECVCVRVCACSVPAKVAPRDGIFRNLSTRNRNRFGSRVCVCVCVIECVCVCGRVRV